NNGDKTLSETFHSDTRSTALINSNGMIYVTSKRGITWKINASTMATVTNNDPGPTVIGAPETSWSSPNIGDDGSIYVTTGLGTSLGSSNPSGHLSKLHPTTLAQEWTVSLGGWNGDYAHFSSPAVYNNKIYVGTRDTKMIYAFNASDGTTAFSHSL